MKKHSLVFPGIFKTEAGGELKDITLSYHTAGTFSAKSKVVWICHALTANSDPEEWWPGMAGANCIYNDEDYFLICANILGSCYGTTGPLSINPETGKPYYRNFPNITVRDMVKAHDMLRRKLGINRIHTVIGSSIGGFQALEMTLLLPDVVERMILLASGCRVTPWATAFNEAQRMAVYADPSYFADIPEGGIEGMKAARATALLSYRSYEGYNSTQAEEETNVMFADRAASYERYQGLKLANRFNAYSYVVISKAFDSHNAGRFRGGTAKALASIKAKTLIVGISNDMLFRPEEQQYMQQHISEARYVEIYSTFGHDGFLLESEQLTRHIAEFYLNHTKSHIK
ncbi:MAG: homoserine O-acetyltransferase [Prevotellaceae bacterium]|jgi:homoserine O-acetyltransferase|nr:homoserine O-acetyltransferase [Prevotellaceae bacterium]